MKERIIYYEFPRGRNLGPAKSSFIGNKLAKIEEVELCHDPKVKNVVALQIRSSLSVEDITTKFKELSKKKVKILKVEDVPEAEPEYDI